VILTPDLSPQVGGVFFSHNVAQEYVEAYDRRYRDMDPWTQGLHRKFHRQDGGFIGEMFVPFEALTKTEFYADFARPQGLHHVCTSLVYEGRLAGDFVSFAMFRGPRQLRFDESERLLGEQLTSHLQRAFVISERLRISERDRRIDSAMLDHASAAIFLVNSSSRILRMTRTAEDMLRDGRHFRSRAGALTSAVDSARLAEAIKGVACHGSVEPFSQELVCRPREAGERAHVLIIKAGAHLPDLAYVVIGAVAGSRTSDATGLLKTLYGVSSAEARLCRELVQGKSLDECAIALSIRRSTAVSQLKSVFAKTSTSRQSDLMRPLIDLTLLA
jgi:DNA-binding CsgD family transcriptional regulator